MCWAYFVGRIFYEKKHWFDFNETQKSVKQARGKHGSEVLRHVKPGAEIVILIVWKMEQRMIQLQKPWTSTDCMIIYSPCPWTHAEPNLIKPGLKSETPLAPGLANNKLTLIYKLSEYSVLCNVLICACLLHSSSNFFVDPLLHLKTASLIYFKVLLAVIMIDDNAEDKYSFSS